MSPPHVPIRSVSPRCRSLLAFRLPRPPLVRRWFRTWLLLALLGMCLGFSSGVARAQGALTSGRSHPGDITPVGDSDSWTLSAAAGASLVVRVGAEALTPHIRIFGPDNAMIAETSSGNAFARDGWLTVTNAAAGNYTIIVNAAYAGQAGKYALHFAQLPGAFEVSEGDQGGELPNGLVRAAELTMGDLDFWRFDAAVGENLIVRVGATNFTPWIRLFGPDGRVVGEQTSGNAFGRDGDLQVVAPQAGTYVAVVGATYGNQVGSYLVNLAKSGTITTGADDEGGELVNGVHRAGRLDLGDLELWTFNAQAGDELMIRAGADNFTPWLRLLGPTGAEIAETTSGNGFTRDGFITVRATNAGPYTVVLGAAYAGQSSEYDLHFAQVPAPITVSPGDEGGELVNGAYRTASLELGDLDVFGFTAVEGQGLMVRVGSTNFTPWIRLYRPDGALAAETTSGNGFARDGSVALRATNAGPYTVVVSATYPGQAGGYAVHLAQAPAAITVSPGDEGGELVSGAFTTAVLDLGDLDVFAFDAAAGQSVVFRVGSTNFTPWLRLYRPDGALAAETTSGNGFARDGTVSLQATNAGTYTIVVSATYSGQAGGYALSFVRIPDPLLISSGDNGGSLTNGLRNTGDLALGDLDTWRFFGSPGDSNVLRVVATNFTPWIRLYGPDGSLVRETTSGNGFAREGAVSLTLTNEGFYTVVVAATYAGQAGTYAFKQSRVPPDLILPETQALDESGTLQVAMSAQDPDEPAKPLVFKVLSAPPGLQFALAGPTNATLTWATTEATGPSTNVVVATVTDTVNGRDFTRTNSFTVVVREINTAPVLTVPADQTLDELTALAVSASATDADLPSNALTYSLASAPAGMTIDPATGAIAWLPGETVGPTNLTVTVVVTDESPAAANAIHLSTTNSFRVTVREVNLAPVLPAQLDRVIPELTTLTVPNAATDADLPANELSYRLAVAPAGAVIGTDGVISWTPNEGQGPSTNTFVTIVQDNGSPVLSATNSFVVVVQEVNTPPQLTVPANQAIPELAAFNASATAVDVDLPANALAYRLVGAPEGMSIGATDGHITWTPTEAQGPSTNTITVIVTDANPGALGGTALSATNSFTLTVTEVNAAPLLTLPGDQTVAELTPLRVSATASDSDVPANSLTFRVLSGPEGLVIGATSGELTWTPTEAQGPSTNTIAVVVTDSNPALAGGSALSTTNSFRVVVTEVNVAPTLAEIADQSLHFGVPLAVQAAGKDLDLPANVLTYSLDQAPTGMKIDSGTGAISWTPLESQVGNHAVVVKLSDGAAPALTATEAFQVTVVGAGTELDITRIAGGLMQIGATGDVGADYELQVSTDLVGWEKLVEFRLSSAKYLYIDPASLTAPLRFYRLVLRQ